MGNRVSSSSSSLRVCCWSGGAAGAEAARAAANAPRGLVAQAAVRPLVVVFLQTPPGEPPRLGQVGKLLAVHQLVAQPAEERFGIAVLPGTARLDVQHLQARSLAMSADRLGDELGAVVAANVPRHAAHQEQIRQHIDHPLGRDAAIHFQCQTFARVFVGDREPLQRLPRRGPIVDEVPRPNMILVFRATPHATVATVAQTPLFVGLSRHFESLTAPQPIDLLHVHVPSSLDAAWPRSIDNRNADAHAPTRACTPPDVAPSQCLSARNSAACSRHDQCPARPTFGHVAAIPHMPDRRTPARRAQ